MPVDIPRDIQEAVFTHATPISLPGVPEPLKVAPDDVDRAAEAIAAPT